MAFTVTPRVRRIAEAEWKLCEMILQNTVQQLGYASLTEAEVKLAGGSS